jgi:hypothetical protein
LGIEAQVEKLVVHFEEVVGSNPLCSYVRQSQRIIAKVSRKITLFIVEQTKRVHSQSNEPKKVLDRKEK